MPNKRPPRNRSRLTRLVCRIGSVLADSRDNNRIALKRDDDDNTALCHEIGNETDDIGRYWFSHINHDD